jgi:monothiol glutaredoxin
MLSDDTKKKIDSLIAGDDVVLFMKGTRDAPRCGFSAAVVEILDEIVPSYRTVDVLADPDIREGIKVYSDWPTIPQLYIKGEFVGGADIAKEMFANGELAKKLGVAQPTVASVVVTLTPAAARMLAPHREKEPADARFLRLAVDARFRPQLGFDKKNAGDAVVASEGFEIVVDAQSAKRANGVVIDAGEGGFKIENPNEPARVKDIGAKELKAKIDQGPIELFDARNEGERAMAKIAGAKLLDDDAREHIESLSKDTPLYFHCHHGGRSRRAAEMYLERGFKNVYNLAGGIDAWSVEVDPQVPRY